MREHTTADGRKIPLVPRPEGEPMPPAPPERLRVALTLEFLPDAVPANHRLRALLKRALRQFRAKCLRCVDVPREADGEKP